MLVPERYVSFAEFEREMIAEWTRDKMESARRKGQGTGGPVTRMLDGGRMRWDSRERALRIVAHGDYLVQQLSDKIKSRRVVVWYDERGEFRPFVDEMRGGARSGSAPVSVAVGGANAHLAEYA